MKKILIFFIMVFVCFCPHLYAGEISLSLDEAVVLALRDNRDVLLKKEGVEKAKLKIAEAQAALFPTVDFAAGWENTMNYYPKNSILISNQVSVKQYLYKGGKTTNDIRANEYSKVVSDALLDKTRLDLVLNVKKTFYALLLADDYVRLNKQIVANSEKHYYYLDARYKKGEVSASDILNIKASLKNVQTAYVASLSQRELLQNLMKNLLYLSDEVRLRPQGKLAYDPLGSLAYEVVFRKAMENRPEIRQYDFQVLADRRTIDATKADARPSIYASWDYYNRSTTGLSGVGTPARGWQDYAVAGLTFSWPVFDGWLTKAKVEQAIVDLKTTQLQKEKVAADIVSEIKNSYLSLKDAIAKIDASRPDIAVYKDHLAVSRQRCRDGLISYLDLDDAELKYSIAVFSQLQAIYDYHIARSELNKSRGELQ